MSSIILFHPKTLSPCTHSNTSTNTTAHKSPRNACYIPVVKGQQDIKIPAMHQQNLNLKEKNLLDNQLGFGGLVCVRDTEEGHSLCPSKTDLSGSYVTRTSGPAFLCCNYRIKVTKLLNNYNYNHDHVAVYPLIFVLSSLWSSWSQGLVLLYTSG